MTRPLNFRSLVSVLLILALLAPVTVLAGNGKKHFRQGQKHEAAEQWDKAAEAYALAVAENPKNPEYQLHYRRAMFMASQMFTRIGASLAAEKDYVGAYNAFRRAFSFDPVNELAKNEMERMLRLQEIGSKPADSAGKPEAAKPGPSQQLPQFETINIGPYPSGIEMQTLIRDLAKTLDLNVIFDAESFRPGSRNPINIELSNVTAAKALDYIFLQQNLFFQKVGPRTIMVANGNRRQNFQQLVLKTFYLQNASPKDVQKVVTTAIPTQPGRAPTTVLPDDATNSLTIRDTEENLRLIGSLIKSLDKDRAEVVMDVAIYEVSKSDLLKLGNQIGNDSQLTTLGGTTRGLVEANSRPGLIAGAIAGAAGLPSAFGVGFAVPSANLSALQTRGSTKLIASTQIHAFNNEDSTARIGQKVPVRSASFAPIATTGGTTPGTNTNNFVGDVIQYESVGLELKFKPLVFPNQDVQVAMEITSKDVVAGGSTQNPTFSDRTIKGTARVQNNRTLLLASVAQDVQSDSKSGIPLLGLIPILGRLFVTPANEKRQVDIVIAITPRVIRVPSILPEDEAERPTGSLAVPTSGSLEDMLIQEEIDERLASARRLGNSAEVQLPDRPAEEPDYVPSTTADAGTEGAGAPAEVKDAVRAVESPSRNSDVSPVEQSDKSAAKPIARISSVPVLPAMSKGEKTRLAIMVNSGSPFRSAVLGLKFDPSNIAVKSVSFGDVFGPEVAGKDVSPFINRDGKTYVALSSDRRPPTSSSGVLAYIEVEALSEGTFEIQFDPDVTAFLTSDGKSFAVRF